MLLTILQDEKVFEFIKSDKSLPQLEVKKFLIFSPSAYGKYIRQILQSAYSSSTINRRMFISDECLDIITNTMKGENGKKSSGKGFQEKFMTVPSRPESIKQPQKYRKRTPIYVAIIDMKYLMRGLTQERKNLMIILML